MTLAWIEPATFRIVAQHLNHCATAVPKFDGSVCKYNNEAFETLELRGLILTPKRRLLYLKPQSVPRAVNTFHLCYKNQSVYAISGTNRCLFSDKYKTHKYSVGRAYSC